MEWLSIEGFSPLVIHGSAPLSPDFPLLVFGSQGLSLEQVLSIKKFLDSGGKMLSFASPYSADINGSWALKENSVDYFIPLLDYIPPSQKKFFNFENIVLFYLKKI